MDAESIVYQVFPGANESRRVVDFIRICFSNNAISTKREFGELNDDEMDGFFGETG